MRTIFMSHSCINPITKNLLRPDDCKCSCKAHWLDGTNEIMPFNFNGEIHESNIKCSICGHFLYIAGVRRVWVKTVEDLPVLFVF